MRRTYLALSGLFLGVAAASVGAQHEYVVHDRNDGRDARILATAPLYPATRTDDTRRPGFNGRLWLGETFDNGVRQPLDWGAPGPSYYGAGDREAPLAWVRIGTQTIAVSPWVRFDDASLPTHERGRQAWLDERNYTGGVRTHVNPALLRSAGERPDRGGDRVGRGDAEIQPAAVIKLRQPRRATPAREREVRSDQPMRISRPAWADALTIRVLSRDRLAARD